MTWLRWFYREVHGRKPERAPQRVRFQKRGPARDYKYRAWIRSLPSAVSGLGPCDACHTLNNGMRSKGSDYSCVPLTRAEHREYDAGRKAFERKYGIEMASLVQRLNAIWELGKREAA